MLWDRLLERPQKPDHAEEDEENLRDSIERYKRKVDFLNSMLNIIHKIKDCLEITEEDEEEIKHLAVLRDELDGVVKTLPAKRSMLDKLKIVKQEMSNLKERGRELKDSVDDEEAYKLLVEAYGNAGIKRLMLQRIGMHLQNCLNRYARYVFSEPYRFKVSIDTQFDILVKRRYASRNLVSDVRKLSGAESRAFTLLLWLSLLSLVPAQNRSNILILDEPDVNMGDEMRENFIKFLPMLNKIVPHIIVITPKSERIYPNATYYTVIKEKGWSRIEQTP